MIEIIYYGKIPSDFRKDKIIKDSVDRITACNTISSLSAAQISIYSVKIDLIKNITYIIL